MGGELCKKMGFTLPPSTPPQPHTHTPLSVRHGRERDTKSLEKSFRSNVRFTTSK